MILLMQKRDTLLILLSTIFFRDDRLRIPFIENNHNLQSTAILKRNTEIRIFPQAVLLTLNNNTITSTQNVRPDKTL